MKIGDVLDTRQLDNSSAKESDFWPQFLIWAGRNKNTGTGDLDGFRGDFDDKLS